MLPYLSLLTLILFLSTSTSREIVFPPLAAVHTPQFQQYLSPFKDDPATLLAGADFNGLTTYANLPYVKCMSDGEVEEKYDIAILGAPFDTVCSNFSAHFNCLFVCLWLRARSKICV